MSEKWTPGPWRVAGKTTKTKGFTILGGYNRDVANVYQRPDFMPEERATDAANAHLIAAAPDMHASSSPIADELGFAEWATPEGAEEILQKIIRDYYPALRTALSRARGE